MVWIKCQEVTIKAAMWIPIAAIIEGKGTVKGLNSYNKTQICFYAENALLVTE